MSEQSKQSKQSKQSDPARAFANLWMESQPKAKAKAEAKAEAPVEFKAPLPPSKRPVPVPRPRAVSPGRVRKPAQRGRSPAKKEQPRAQSQSPISRQKRGQAMKDRARSASAASATRNMEDRDSQEKAEVEAAKLQAQNTTTSMQKYLEYPSSGFTQREKDQREKELAEADKKRQKLLDNSKRQVAALRAKEVELQRREAELAEKEKKFAAIERGEWEPSYSGQATAGPSPGPGYEVTRPPNWPEKPFPTPIHRQTRMQTPPPAIIPNNPYEEALGKKRKSSKSMRPP